jgi:cupin superfamily acireductone dioxygenase involved in methionine salvage
MIKNFYDEHLHVDEEIRYILDGEGYFDVNMYPDDISKDRFVIRMNDGFDVPFPKAIL